MAITLRASGIFNIMRNIKGRISGTFDVNAYAIHFFKFSNIRRPSSIAVMMEAKLSSSNIMSAASFDTLDPVIPMAIPMSAFLSAGESLTPSPKIHYYSLKFFQLNQFMYFIFNFVIAMYIRRLLVVEIKDTSLIFP